MSTIANKLLSIKNSKEDIKDAIEAKGVLVGNVPFSLYASKIAEISVGEEENNDDDMTDINKVYYIDHTGHIHYQYTLEEFLELEEEPANPAFSGLTPTGWQMSLANALAFVRTYGWGPVIGLTYTTNDGTTRVYINIDDDSLKSFSMYYSGLSNANKTKLKIDWGDGSEMDLSNAAYGYFSHTYAQQGEYVIKYIPEDSTISYVPASNAAYSSMFGYYYESAGQFLLDLITKIEFGGNISGYLGALLVERCESVSIPYGCSVGILYGLAPKYLFSTGLGSVTSLPQTGDIYNGGLKELTLPEGTLTTSGNYNLNTNLKRVILPSTLTGFPIFTNCLELLAISIPTTSSIASSSNNTFANCYSLKKVTLPGLLTTLGTSMFSSCYSLEELSLPNSITTFGNNAFLFCYNLKTINIPTSLTTIGNTCFLSCIKLEGPITIPSGVTSIPQNCFLYCWNLKKVTLPNTMTTIGSNAFSYCTSLEEINLPASLTTLNANTFLMCVNLKGILNFPSGLTSIPNNCFLYCYSITKIVIPNTVTSIGTNAFSYCYDLKEILFPQNGLTSIENYAFNRCLKLEGIINIPEGVTIIGQNSFSMSTFKVTEIIIPSTVTTIRNAAFATLYNTSPNTSLDKVVHVKATTPPTAGTNIFSTINGIANKLTIYVPAASVDAYKAATNWKTYKDIIFAEPTP